MKIYRLLHLILLLFSTNIWAIDEDIGKISSVKLKIAATQWRKQLKISEEIQLSLETQVLMLKKQLAELDNPHKKAAIPLLCTACSALHKKSLAIHAKIDDGFASDVSTTPPAETSSSRSSPLEDEKLLDGDYYYVSIDGGKNSSSDDEDSFVTDIEK